MIQYFTATTIHCRCQKKRSVFRELGMYNFVRIMNAGIFAFITKRKLGQVLFPKNIPALQNILIKEFWNSKIRKHFYMKFREILESPNGKKDIADGKTNLTFSNGNILPNQLFPEQKSIRFWWLISQFFLRLVSQKEHDRFEKKMKMICLSFCY